MEASALQTKLTYIEAEAQQRAELERIQILKELDTAQGKIVALEELKRAMSDPLSYNNLKDNPKVSPE